MLDTVDQVVRILALESLIKCERLQAGEADEIGVPDDLGRNASATEKLGLNLSGLIQVEDDRRMRNVQGREPAERREDVGVSHALLLASVEPDRVDEEQVSFHVEKAPLFVDLFRAARRYVRWDAPVSYAECIFQSYPCVVPPQARALPEPARYRP